MYTEAELEQARVRMRMFSDSFTLNRIIADINSGKSSVTLTAMKWLDPIIFEVDETGGFAVHLNEFLNELITIEERRRISGITPNNKLTGLIFEKSVEPEQDGETTESGQAKLRRFCAEFIVQIVPNDPKKVAVNSVNVAIRLEGMALENAKKTFVALANVSEEMANTLCGSLSSALFRSTSAKQFAEAAINFAVDIPKESYGLRIFINSLVRSLGRTDEQEQGTELLIMLGTKIPEFWPIWKTLKHAVGDDKSYIHAKKVLVGIAKEKTKPEDIEFMEKVFSNIDELLWAAERRISERGREMCTDVASASVFSINAIILLMELAEKYGYNEQCENVIGEIATYPKMTFHTARECAKRFEPGGDELCEGDKLRNSALIRIATKLLEGPKWRETTAGIEFRLGKQETTKRGRAVAFAERVVQEIDEKTADLVLKRMAIAISFERKTGVRELFDRLLAKDGTIKDAAMHAIAMEMFGLLGPHSEKIKDGIADYVGARTELEGRITEQMVKMARCDEVIRKKMRGYVQHNNPTIRRIATVAYNLSTNRIGTSHVPRRTEVRRPVGISGSANGRIHT